MIEASLSYKTINMILLVTAVLLLSPFMIADLYFLYNDTSTCMIMHIPSNPSNIYQVLFLAQWLYYDGYIKLAMIMAAFYFTMLRSETNYDKMLTICLANIFRIFWIFNLGWNITGGVLFWGAPPAYSKFCDYDIYHFMWATLICNYMTSIFGFLTTLIRGSATQSRKDILQNTGNIYT